MQRWKWLSWFWLTSFSSSAPRWCSLMNYPFAFAKVGFSWGRSWPCTLKPICSIDWWSTHGNAVINVEYFKCHCSSCLLAFKNPKSYVVNIGETNICIDSTGAIKVTDWGSKTLKTVSVKSSGSSAHCSIFLAVTMDGQNLHPFII